MSLWENWIPINKDDAKNYFLWTEKELPYACVPVDLF